MSTDDSGSDPYIIQSIVYLVSGANSNAPQIEKAAKPGLDTWLYNEVSIKMYDVTPNL